MPAPVLRCLTVWLVATAAAAALATWLVPIALAPTDGFDAALVRLCAGVGALATGWLWLVTTAAVVEAATGAGVRGVPVPVRRLVLAACGVAIVTGLAVPAQATPGDQHRDRRPSLSGLPYPDRAATPPRAQPAARPSAQPSAQQSARRVAQRSEQARPETVVVRAGDTLWGLARADLGPDADPAEINTRWREIYAQNRGVIGPDPDLIQPAQRLRLPAHHDQ